MCQQCVAAHAHPVEVPIVAPSFCWLELAIIKLKDLVSNDEFTPFTDHMGNLVISQQPNTNPKMLHLTNGNVKGLQLLNKLGVLKLPTQSRN